MKSLLTLFFYQIIYFIIAEVNILCILSLLLYSLNLIITRNLLYFFFNLCETVTICFEKCMIFFIYIFLNGVCTIKH